MRKSLLDARVSEVVSDEWRAEYLRGIDVIWAQLIHLNGGLFILDHIVKFPWDLFGSRSPSDHFWDFTREALFLSSVLTIWRLCVDNDAEGLSIGKFKNGIVQHMNEEFKGEFFDHLQQSGFEKGRTEIEMKVSELRQNYFAHLNYGKHAAPTEADRAKRFVGVAELLGYADRLRGFFRVLCFGEARGDAPLGYLRELVPAAGTDPRPDIDVLLDSIAYRSHAIRAFRSKGVEWDLYCQVLSAAQVEVLQQWNNRLLKYKPWIETSP